ncbi:hypothetical protein ScPMuIL_007461 [Solemya velum]
MSSSGAASILSLVARLVLLISVCLIWTSSAVPSGRTIGENAVMSKAFTEKEIANRLLERMMDVAYETFRELGGSERELGEVQRKRSMITACYFQAVTCY